MKCIIYIEAVAWDNCVTAAIEKPIEQSAVDRKVFTVINANDIDCNTISSQLQGLVVVTTENNGVETCFPHILAKTPRWCVIVMEKRVLRELNLLNQETDFVIYEDIVVYFASEVDFHDTV